MKQFCTNCWEREQKLTPVKPGGYIFCPHCMEYKIVSERERQLIKRGVENDKGKKDIEKEAERSL
jgi:hypothetical protein